ncbi:hypothetical protein R3P38DRAFT_3215055 [Favolaschia claudopus]|uniref:Uncharacterized protein n=1 Tax=Favolaschia claudopus TaxID=2862362 RepID=A0AAW0A921_9AGAR
MGFSVSTSDLDPAILYARSLRAPADAYTGEQQLLPFPLSILPSTIMHHHRPSSNPPTLRIIWTSQFRQLGGRVEQRPCGVDVVETGAIHQIPKPLCLGKFDGPSMVNLPPDIAKIWPFPIKKFPRSKISENGIPRLLIPTTTIANSTSSNGLKPDKTLEDVALDAFTRALEYPTSPSERRFERAVSRQFFSRPVSATCFNDN